MDHWAMVNEARQIAMTTPPTGSVFHAAMGICRMRMLDPNAQNLSAGLLNWQAIVAEQALCEMLQTELRR